MLNLVVVFMLAFGFVFVINIIDRPLMEGGVAILLMVLPTVPLFALVCASCICECSGLGLALFAIFMVAEFGASRLCTD